MKIQYYQVTNPGCSSERALGLGTIKSIVPLIGQHALPKSTTCGVHASSEEVTVEFLNTLALSFPVPCVPHHRRLESGTPSNDTVQFGSALTL